MLYLMGMQCYTNLFFMKKELTKPFLFFLPVLFTYVIIVMLLHKDLMEGDEGRYYMYATNLIHGFYSPREEVFLWNGPGYPIILMPFVALKLPLIFITIFNALFQYVSVVLLYKTLIKYVSPAKSLLFSIFWACYYISFKEMGLIYTESFTIFLVVAFQYSIVLVFKKTKKKYLIIAGLLLGFIILTKIIFGYVVITLLAINFVTFLFLRKNVLIKTSAVLIIALLSNMPYLFYTYNLTGKLFYWANSGGSSLYWASSPFEGEYGDWNNDDFNTYCNIDSLIPCNASKFAKNHEADFKIFRQYSGVEKDMAFKKKAIENIKNYPLKYFKNYITNLGRMFFQVPQSFFYQRFQNLMRIPPNAIIFTFLMLSGMITVLRFTRIKYEILFLVLFTFIYLTGSAMLSSDQRQFYIIVPIILFWTANIFQQFISINFNRSDFGNNNSNTKIKL